MATAAQKQQELQALRSERAQVEAELARIRGQAPAVAASVRTVAPAAAPAAVIGPPGGGPDRRMVVLGVVALGLGYWLWSRRGRR